MGVLAESWELYSSLVMMVVEGRTPGGDKGYRAGPHTITWPLRGGPQHACNDVNPVVSVA